jgi:hypothetical protein
MTQHGRRFVGDASDASNGTAWVLEGAHREGPGCDRRCDGIPGRALDTSDSVYVASLSGGPRR